MSEEINTIEEVETGDKLTVTYKDETVADGVEVTDIGTEGFSGMPAPETDGEIDRCRDLFGLLCEALGTNSDFSHHYEVVREDG